MVWKINFSQVAKISCRLVQKWPRYKKKPQKWTLKNDFSEKSPRILNFWKKFLKTYIKRANLAETDISGYEIYLTGPSRAMWLDMLLGPWANLESIVDLMAHHFFTILKKSIVNLCYHCTHNPFVGFNLRKVAVFQLDFGQLVLSVTNIRRIVGAENNSLIVWYWFFSKASESHQFPGE